MPYSTESEELGRGSRGRVLVGDLSHAAGVPVAFKVLRAACGAEAPREAPLACSVHPSVVHVICSLKDTPGRLVEVREFISGGELFDDVAENGPMAVEDAASFLHQAASGVEHMHADGLASGQLRLEHLLRDASGVLVKLLPFYNSITERDDGGPSGALLRPLQALDPPEWGFLPVAADGTRHAPRASLPAADVWGLGIALSAMLTGAPPFASTDPTKCAALHSTSPPSA